MTIGGAVVQTGGQAIGRTDKRQSGRSGNPPGGAAVARSGDPDDLAVTRWKGGPAVGRSGCRAVKQSGGRANERKGGQTCNRTGGPTVGQSVWRSGSRAVGQSSVQTLGGSAVKLSGNWAVGLSSGWRQSCGRAIGRAPNQTGGRSGGPTTGRADWLAAYNVIGQNCLRLQPHAPKQIKFPKKCSKTIGKIIKRASVRFRFLQWPFENFEKF